MENIDSNQHSYRYVKIYSAPIEGIEIIEPLEQPGPNDVLLGYVIVTYDGCIVKPRPMKMSVSGWLLSGALAVIFFPLMCVPCFLKSSYNVYQRPVYKRTSN